MAHSLKTIHWKVKLLLPILYFIGALALFYVISSQSNFVLDGFQIVGIIISAVMFVVWLMARVQLANAFSVSPEVSTLVKSGIYSKLRHPVYVFSFFALFGIILFVENPFLFLLLIPLLILQIHRVRKEEKVLLMRFGAEYTEYKRATWF